MDDQAGTPGDGAGAGQGWAVPGSAVAQPVPVTLAEPVAVPGWPTPRADATAAAGAAEVPRVGLHPRTTADILDGGFAVLKARPKRIMAVTAVFVVPTQLLAAFLQRDAAAFDLTMLSSDPTVLEEQSAGAEWELMTMLLVLALVAAALVCVAAALAHLVTQWMMGRDPAAGELLGVVGRRAWPLLASFVLVKLAEAAGAFACYIGIAFVMPLFVVVAPVIAVEGAGPLAAMRRSVRLTGPRYFPVLGVALVMAIVSELLALALSALPQALVAWIGTEDGWPVLAVGGIAAELVVVPFVAAATVLLYLDLRVRTEGLDVEMAAARVLDRAT